MLNDVLRHAAATAPAECCGLLLGVGDLIVEAVPAANLSADPRRYLIDPERHISARREARVRGLAVLGFYHSHPDSAAEPSPTDLSEASYPDHLYLIAGFVTTSPELRLFRLQDRNFVSVELVTAS